MRKASFVFFPDSKTSIATLVADLVNALIKRFDLTSATAPTIINVLSFCLETGHKVHFQNILNPLVDDKQLTPNRVQSFLVPFIGDLSNFLSQKGISQSFPPFAFFFKTSMIAWIKKVLGTKPTDTPADLVTTLAALKACCPSCKSVAKAMETGSSRAQQIRLDRIGAPQAKHLDAKMRSCCRSSVGTWSIIQTTPRGFMVRP